MSKQTISRIILAVMIVANIYLVYRVDANNTAITSYDAGISQRSGVGKLESFWTKYVGGSKDSSMTYEDRDNAANDSSFSIGLMFVLDIIAVAALYMLNKKPKPAPVQDDDDDWRRSSRSRSSRRRR